MCFIFDRFRLIPSSYLAGRLVAKAAALLGGGIVLLVWPFVVGKKRDDSDDEPWCPVSEVHGTIRRIEER